MRICIYMNQQVTDMNRDWTDREPLADRLERLCLSRPELLKKNGSINQNAVARHTGVNQPTIKRMLDGESDQPRPDNIEKLARYFKVSAAAVRGEAPIDTSHINTSDGPEVKGRIPVISWIQAGEFCEATDLFAPGDADEWVLCTRNHSKSTYALKIKGVSMEPRFFEGDIVIIDPEIEPTSGKFVVAKKTGYNEVTFKQFQEDSDFRYLKALNPAWPDQIIRIDSDWHICGVAIQLVNNL